MDIEDLHDEGEGRTGLLQAHVKRVSRVDASQDAASQSEAAATAAAATAAASCVPGTQRIWVKTFGCSHNSSDSEYMCGQLQEYGFT